METLFLPSSTTAFFKNATRWVTNEVEGCGGRLCRGQISVIASSRDGFLGLTDYAYCSALST